LDWTGRHAMRKLALAALALASVARAQTCDSTGANLIVGNLSSAMSYAPAGGIAAFSFGFSACNLGDQPAQWIASTSQHPATASNLYKYTIAEGVGRFEQIGMGWLFHEFFALQSSECCTDCTAGTGSTLGRHCSSPNSASAAGYQNNLGPRWEVNALTGTFP